MQPKGRVLLYKSKYGRKVYLSLVYHGQPRQIKILRVQHRTRTAAKIWVQRFLKKVGGQYVE